MSFDPVRRLREAASGLSSIGHAFGEPGRVEARNNATRQAELAQQQLEQALTSIKRLLSGTPEQAQQAFDLQRRGLNATTEAGIQLNRAAANDTIAVTDAAGQVRKGLIGAQSNADIAGLRERFSNTRALLGDQQGHDYKMGTLFVGDPAQGGMSLAERASNEAAANRELALSLADRLAPKRSFLDQVGAGIVGVIDKLPQYFLFDAISRSI